MGGICSKRSTSDKIEDYNIAKESNHSNYNNSVQLIAPTASKRELLADKSVGCGGGGNGNGYGVKDGSNRGGGSYSSRHRSSTHGGGGGDSVKLDWGDNKKDIIVERPSGRYHQRRATMDLGGASHKISRVPSMARDVEGEQAAAGWPTWLTSVAAEAIQGWVPRRADSFEKIKKIGQGTYSSVYKARDLEKNMIVAVKKVRFVNMDPESVRFMAREISILRRLDHPNVMKLEGIVTSRSSGSLYLVFEYMEHDLSGLAATQGTKFTEPQIKCYMKQLLLGLEHCHNRGVLHRDIKGSNLLIDKNGNLKIGDFGLATFFQPDQEQPLTSRVVTLWYRPPELLLGATQYGVAIDMWSTGCILAELFAGKPIMPGQTEVEQMHKIFKLCGSPGEDYWQKSKFPQATGFKPQQPYKRSITETFKNFPPSALALLDKLLSIEPEKRGTASSALRSELFTTEPLPCDPSSLPKYRPSKELDIKIRNEEARRQKGDSVKGRGPESVRRGTRDIKGVASPEFMTEKSKIIISTSHKHNPKGGDGAGYTVDAQRGAMQNGRAHPSSMIHPAAAAWNKNNGGSTSVRYNGDIRTSTIKKDDHTSVTGYVRKKNRIHYSGPLMPPGGNIEDVLKEHERQIQLAVRKARLEKNGTNKKMA